MQEQVYPHADTRADAGMFQTEIAICEREQRAIQDRADVREGMAPAWLVTLGMEDWEAEKRLIRQGVRRPATYREATPCK